MADESSTASPARRSASVRSSRAAAASPRCPASRRPPAGRSRRASPPPRRGPRPRRRGPGPGAPGPGTPRPGRPRRRAPDPAAPRAPVAGAPPPPPAGRRRARCSRRRRRSRAGGGPGRAARRCGGPTPTMRRAASIRPRSASSTAWQRSATASTAGAPPVIRRTRTTSRQRPLARVTGLGPQSAARGRSARTASTRRRSSHGPRRGERPVEGLLGGTDPAQAFEREGVDVVGPRLAAAVAHGAQDGGRRPDRRDDLGQALGLGEHREQALVGGVPGGPARRRSGHRLERRRWRRAPATASPAVSRASQRARRSSASSSSGIPSAGLERPCRTARPPPRRRAAPWPDRRPGGRR